MGDTRTDSGQFYPGGKVIPRQPVRPGGGSDADAVHYYAETRTEEQKAQARANIGAGTSNFSGDYNSLKNMPQSFTPSAHASTHAAGGTDQVTVAQSQVTGLVGALAGKAPVAHTHDKIVDGDLEIRADLTAKVQSGWTDRWEPSETTSYYDFGWYDNMNGWCCREVGEPITLIPMRGDYTNPDATELTFPDGVTVTHRVPNIVDANILTDRDVAAPSPDAAEGNVAGAKATGDALAEKLPTSHAADTTLHKTTADITEIAKVKDKADEFTEWVVYGDGKPSGVLTVVLSDNELFWELYINGNRSRYESNIDYQTDTYFQFYDSLTIEPQNFFAKRTKVLRTGDAATPQDVSNAVAPKADKTSFAPEYSTSSAYAVGDYVWHDGEIFQCKVAVAAPGEPWTAAHWDGPQKLRDLFSESNTSLVQAVDAKAATSAANIPDRGVAVVDGSSGTAASKQTVTVSFAAAKGTELRMCELLITDVAEDDAVTVSLPAGTYQFADGADATKEADGNHFIFTEYARGCWFVNRVSTEEMEVV